MFLSTFFLSTEGIVTCQKFLMTDFFTQAIYENGIKKPISLDLKACFYLRLSSVRIIIFLHPSLYHNGVFRPSGPCFCRTARWITSMLMTPIGYSIAFLITVCKDGVFSLVFCDNTTITKFLLTIV